MSQYQQNRPTGDIQQDFKTSQNKTLGPIKVPITEAMSPEK
jgi:hypothetical protein